MSRMTSLLILIFLLLPLLLFSQTDRFEITPRAGATRTLVLGATVYIVNVATSDSLQLSELSGSRAGTYYRNNVPYGQYNIWVNGNLVKQNHPFGVYRTREFIEAVDTDADNRIETAGIEDGAITTTKYQDSSITLAKMTSSTIAGLGGTVTNAEDNISIIESGYVLSVNPAWLDTTSILWKLYGHEDSSGLDYYGVYNHLMNTKIYSVKDYGAYGDSIHDDYAYIQAAIDSAISEGGELIYFPQGNFLVSDTLEITESYLTFAGEGRLCHTNTNGTMLSIIGTLGNEITDIKLKYLKMRGSGNGSDAVKSDAIEFIYANNIEIHSCKFDSFNVGIELTNCDNVNIHDNYIADMVETSDYINGYGILLEECDNVTISKTQLDSIDRHAIYLNGGNDITIDHCIINSKQIEISSSHYEIPIKLTDPEKVTISNNHLNYGLGGIWFTTAFGGDQTTGAKNVTIHDNIFSDKIENAGFASGYIWMEDCTVENLKLHDNTYIRSRDHCINIEGDGNIIIHNEIIDSTYLANGVAIRLVGNGDGLLKPKLHHNTIIHYPYGISVASGVTAQGDNNYFSYVNTPVYNNNGNECSIINNHMIDTVRHVVQDSVIDASTGQIFVVNDSEADTIYNITGGTTGQIITLAFTNNNSSVDGDGPYIVLQDSLIFKGHSGAHLTLQRSNAVYWSEIGRTEDKGFTFEIIQDTVCSIMGTDTVRINPPR